MSRVWSLTEKIGGLIYYLCHAWLWCALVLEVWEEGECEYDFMSICGFSMEACMVKVVVRKRRENYG